MTENEAIETIKSNMPTSGYYTLRESLEMAIQALEEVQEYRKIGTVEEVREAVEKQKPKKLVELEDRILHCPFCGNSTSLAVKSVQDLEECANFEKCNYCYYVAVVCDFNKGGCGASSGYRESEEEAIKAWNMRYEEAARERNKGNE